MRMPSGPRLAMRWSTRLIILGVLIFAIGFVPLKYYGLTVPTLENASAFFAVGILITLLGVLIRRINRAFKTG